MAHKNPHHKNPRMAVLLMVQVRIRVKDITRDEKRPFMTRKETIQQKNIITEVQNTESKMEAEGPRNRSCSYGRGLEHTLLVNRIRRQKTKAGEVRHDSVGEVSHDRGLGGLKPNTSCCCSLEIRSREWVALR